MANNKLIFLHHTESILLMIQHRTVAVVVYTTVPRLQVLLFLQHFLQFVTLTSVVRLLFFLPTLRLLT